MQKNSPSRRGASVSKNVSRARRAQKEIELEMGLDSPPYFFGFPLGQIRRRFIGH